MKLGGSLQKGDPPIFEMITLDAVIDFTYSRNELWRGMVTKEQLRRVFEQCKDTTLILSDKKENIIAVIIYLLCNGKKVVISYTTAKKMSIKKVAKMCFDGDVYYMTKKYEVVPCPS